MTAHHHRQIDEEVAAAIRALHKRHPKLGHHGLLEALRQDGIWVDAEELERFIEEHNIKSESEWRPLKFRGVSRYFVAPDVTRGDRMKGTFEDD